MLAVEDEYVGPRLDGEITAEFMKDLMQHFKDQKILHKKYAYKVWYTGSILIRYGIQEVS